jgi:ubiquinone/menaquinone biosynthesis C-methylase UbiE
VTPETPAFASDPATASYYERRAEEYDDWYTGEGLFAQRDRPGWHDEVARMVGFVKGLAAARTLAIACGTGFLTRYLKGFVVGLDQSPTMVAIAQSRLPNGLAIVGDALDLVVADRSFDRVFTGHFYGHLSPEERTAFMCEVRRVATELIVIDSAFRPDRPTAELQERILNDGSRHSIYKRYLTADQLADELQGEVLFDGAWFVGARAKW